MKAIQIKVQLNWIKPSIYRTFLVEEDCDFLELHYYIQSAFWFDHSHLRHFEYKNWRETQFCITDEEDTWWIPKRNPRKTEILDLYKKWMKKFTYTYDFWDNWEFTVTIVKELEVKRRTRATSNKKISMTIFNWRLWMNMVIKWIIRTL